MMGYVKMMIAREVQEESEDFDSEFSLIQKPSPAYRYNNRDSAIIIYPKQSDN